MLTASLCLDIVRAACPDLPLRSYSFNDRGQNNDVLIVNGEFVFRFPRTARAARQLRVEAAILNHLQARVALRVPNPVYLSLEEVSPSPSARGSVPGGRSLHGQGSPLRSKRGPLSLATAGRLSTNQGPAGRIRLFGRGLRGAPSYRPLGGPGNSPDLTPGTRLPDGRMPWEQGLGGRLPWESDPAVDTDGEAERVRQAQEALRRAREAHKRGGTPGARGVFVGYRWIPGEPLWRDRLLAADDSQTIQVWADQMAAFLGELHSTPIEGRLAELLPPFDGQARWANFYGRLQNTVYPFMRRDARASVSQLFDAFLGEPSNFDHPYALVHGDFSPSNILFDPDGRRLTGVIDFGSSGLDDPALDLAALMSPYGYGEAFVRRLARGYPVTEPVLDRARFYVSTFALQDALFGLEHSDAEAFNWGIEAYR